MGGQIRAEAVGLNMISRPVLGEIAGACFFIVEVGEEHDTYARGGNDGQIRARAAGSEPGTKGSADQRPFISVYRSGGRTTYGPKSSEVIFS